MASLGAELKQAREKRGVTLEELSQSTKIGTRLLRALEQDNYDQLPGGIFTKGFIRAYARAVGVDDEKAIADYLAATEPNLPEPQGANGPGNRIVEVSELGTAEDLPWGWFALVLVIAAAALAGWGYYSRHKTSLPRSPVASPSVSQAAQPLPQFPASPVVAAASGKDAVRKAEAAGTASASPASDSAAGPYFSVQVNVREDSWLSISSDGKTVLQGNFAAPAVKSVKARNQIVVKAGNVGGLDFEFNGESLPAQGAAGELKSLVFGADGLEATEETPAPQP